MPKAMKVDYGTQPESVNSHVAFRTNYYFRVFGDCATPSGNGDLPAYSGLYRFRMTGKANTLTNRIKFESGILPAKSIDPFGVSLRYDENSDSLTFLDQQHAAREAKLARLAELLGELKKVRDSLPPAKSDEAEKTTELGKAGDATRLAFESVIKTLVDEVGKLGMLRDLDVPTEAWPHITVAHSALLTMLTELKGHLTDEQRKALIDKALQRFDQAHANLMALVEGVARGKGCTRNQRGFLILGPEGWKQFNPEDRLIMAMYSSGRPLIATLNELSARALRTEGASAEASLVYAEHDGRIVRSISKLHTFRPEDPQSAIASLQAAVDELSAGEAKP
jgi:hypothetical protein